MGKELPFDPSQVTYAQRFTSNGTVKKDGTKGKKCGPYWYANWFAEGRIKTFYIGKVLPDECKPFAPNSTYIDNPSQRKRGHIPITYRGASDTLMEVLDKGEQVVIDVPKIASDCNAQFTSIGNGRYLIYRDPK